MNRMLRFCCLVIGAGLFSCSKNVQVPLYSSYYGQWQFIGYIFGPRYITPSPDSVVILSLKPGNTYETTLNSNLVMQGQFTIDSGANRTILRFLNITQPFGSDTAAESNGIYFFLWNTAKIGQLTLFQNNITSIPSDTLGLTSYPVSPEFTSNYFKRIQ